MIHCKYLTEMKPVLVYNLYKTGKVLAPKRYRNVYRIQQGNEKKTTLTVLLVFSASGHTVASMIVFPYVYGWMDENVVNTLPENW